MKVAVVAQLLEDLYNQGRVTSDGKLDNRDFEQLTILARGEAIRMQLEKAIRMYGAYGIPFDGGLFEHYTSLETKKVEGESKKYFKTENVMSLQNGFGMFNIIGTPDGSSCEGKLYFSRINAGTSWQVSCEDMDDNEVAFEPLGEKVVLHNLPDCVDELEVLVINDSGLDTDIPTEVGYTILKMCFDIAMKAKMFVVDSLDDYSTTDDQKRNLLAQYQAQDEQASKSI